MLQAPDRTHQRLLDNGFQYESERSLSYKAFYSKKDGIFEYQVYYECHGNLGKYNLIRCCGGECKYLRPPKSQSDYLTPSEFSYLLKKLDNKWR